MGFKEVKAEELTMNPFTKIGKEWLLITAGNEEKCNTMTASWGAMGVMWGKNTVTVYIRPQRYTKEFVDREERFTTVSYTHLDVYKRQPLKCAARIFACFLSVLPRLC